MWITKDWLGPHMIWFGSYKPVRIKKFCGWWGGRAGMYLKYYDPELYKKYKYIRWKDDAVEIKTKNKIINMDNNHPVDYL